MPQHVLKAKGRRATDPDTEHSRGAFTNEPSGRVRPLETLARRLAASSPEAMARFSEALERSAALACLLSSDGVVLAVAPGAPPLPGGPSRDVLGSPIWETAWWNYDAAIQLQLRDAVQAADAEGECCVDIDLCLGPSRYLPVECQLVRLSDGQGLALIANDLSGRRAAENRQLMLMAELDHRIKNMLSVIQAMIGQTARYAQSTEDLVASLQGRVRTMAEVHGLLTRSTSAQVGLRDLILRELRTLVADPDLCAVSGPEIALPPRAVTSMSLVIHELTTNAAKYGAFAGAGGSLRVSWDVEAREDGGRLSLVWAEKSPKPIAPPLRTGFGTHLIAHTVRSELGGQAEFSYAASGLVCVLALPLDRLQERA